MSFLIRAFETNAHATGVSLNEGTEKLFLSLRISGHTHTHNGFGGNAQSLRSGRLRRRVAYLFLAFRLRETKVLFVDLAESNSNQSWRQALQELFLNRFKVFKLKPFPRAPRVCLF